MHFSPLRIVSVRRKPSFTLPKPSIRLEDDVSMLCCHFREKALSILSTFLFRTPMELHMINTKHLSNCLVFYLVQKEGSNATKARTCEACRSKTNPHRYSVRNLLFNLRESTQVIGTRDFDAKHYHWSPVLRVRRLVVQPPSE